MDVLSIRTLRDTGQYDAGLRAALALAGGDGPPESRAEAYLLAAECATRLGDGDQAQALLGKGLELAPPDSELVKRASLLLGRAYLRRNEISLAEQVFLETLARNPDGSKFALHARFHLGQVFEAQRRWDAAADTYQRAAEGFDTLRQPTQALMSRHNAAWALIMAGDTAVAGLVLATCADSPEQADERISHAQKAMTAYLLYRTGATAEAADMTAELVARVGPNRWASCLAAITAGWLALEAGMAPEATKALALAESLMYAASHETGSTDIINLVGELRARAA